MVLRYGSRTPTQYRTSGRPIALGRGHRLSLRGERFLVTFVLTSASRQHWNPDYIANGALACVAEHEWAKAAYADAMNQVLNTHDVNIKTGPGCIARTLKPDMEGVVVLPPTFFYPVHYRNKEVELQREGPHYTTHLWLHDW